MRIPARTLIVAAVLTCPTVVTGQDLDSHWGIQTSFAPNGMTLESLRELFLKGDGAIEAQEFTVGLVRGSSQGGEWGVSFVRKPFKNGTTVSNSYSSCVQQFCNSIAQAQVMREVALQGIEFHWFVPFTTIRNRVQIGLNLGGGAAGVSGTIDETVTFNSTFRQPNGQMARATNRDTFSERAKDAFEWPIYPLAKLEAQAALLLTPAVKITVAGGFNYPGTGVRVGSVILLGAK